MIASQIIQQEGLVLIRNKKEEHVKGAPWNYDVKEAFTGSKKGWIYLDHFTKSAMRVIYDALSSNAKSKYDNIHFLRLVDFTWEHVK